jgi:hypothetical protein
MNEKTEKKLNEIAGKYIPLLDKEIELAQKQLELTRKKYNDRKILSKN